MKIESLSYVERLQLINQFEIQSLLKDDPEAYKTEIKILRMGYTGLYDNLFSYIGEEEAPELTQETSDILNMFRTLNNSIGGLTEEQKASIDLNALEFEGFDGHEKHYHVFVMWLDEGLWEEHKNKEVDSHDSSTITKYRTLLELYNSFNLDGHVLTYEQLQILSLAVS